MGPNRARSTPGRVTTNAVITTIATGTHRRWKFAKVAARYAVAPSAPITNGGPVSFVVTYTDANALGITLAPGNVTVNATGTAAASGVSVTGTGNTRTVTLSGITGDGTLGITLAAGTATDPAGNAAPADGPGATFAVDNTAPTLVIGAPSAPATATAPVSFDITYSGASAITLAPGDITLVRTGTANAGTVAVTGTGNVRTVTLSGITGDGTIAIAVAANTAADAAGNPAPSSRGPEIRLKPVASVMLLACDREPLVGPPGRPIPKGFAC